MVAKFLFAIAAIIAVMVALILLTVFSNGNNNNDKSSTIDQTQINIQYSRQKLVGTNPRTSASTNADVLTIENDGSAKYRNPEHTSTEKTFLVSSEDVRQLKDLILGSGFLNIPSVDYKPREGIATAEKYTLEVNVHVNDNNSKNNNDTSKTYSWDNPESYEVGTNNTTTTTIITSPHPPSILTNIGARLDNIISKYI
jgi:hypothetical protein